LLRTAALGAAECPGVDAVVVTTGEHLDPTVLGELPGHVVVHRFLPQDAALSQIDVVVSHAGSGTVLGALKQALPTVSLPMGADQQLNAGRLQALGLGVSLPADQAGVGEIRDAVAGVLASSAIRQELGKLRDEFRTLSGLDGAIQFISDLAA
jgi:MGT family glycosyltransferase